MSEDQLMSPNFPRASRYHPDWLRASASGGANSLWLTEWLTSALELRPGMRVLDLGCGRAASSIFLHREFGVQVWSADLWFSADENRERIRDAGVAEGAVNPVQADARSLPFEPGFFDAIVSIDSFFYYGTDHFYLNYLARFLKPEGWIGMAGAGLTQEIEGELPEHLREWWTSDLWSLHSAGWWRRQWERSGILDVTLADAMPDGWRRWLDWIHFIAPENAAEIRALEADAGRCIGYTRAVGRLKPGVDLAPISIPTSYTKQPLLR